MKKYLIQITETNLWRKVIEAESEKDALAKHETEWEGNGYTYEFHDWKDGNSETDVLRELKDDTSNSSTWLGENNTFMNRED